MTCEQALSILDMPLLAFKTVLEILWCDEDHVSVHKIVLLLFYSVSRWKTRRLLRLWVKDEVSWHSCEYRINWPIRST